MTRSKPTADEAPHPSRKERREHKRRLHEARKKAKALGKANDRRGWVGEKRDRMDMQKGDKKAEKGMQREADKKAEKVRKRRQKQAGSG